ncbi:MAG: DNA replication/repair protein RecF [Paludibacteraceae bacterium]|nr:DNA replication/repair protein RecF [Paludibacteraceae bacterium]
MILTSLNILNYRNIREASLEFAPKLNCFVGLNGQGKTNVLDAIYLLSFAKSAFTSQDSLNITHGEEMAMVQGNYKISNDQSQMSNGDSLTISCGLRKGVKKQFRRDKKDYPRLIDHIGLIPLVMISPSDQQLIDEGSDERRRFMDVVISQLDRKYLDCLTTYNALLKQRNALLKQYGDAPNPPDDLLEVLEWQMIEPAEYIFAKRTAFFEAFEPYFAKTYAQISGSAEIPQLRYISQLQDRDLREAYVRTRQRDLILGWTSQGVHKDDLEMRLGDYPLKQVGSQGQQRTFVLAMKLAQALYLSYSEPASGLTAEGGPTASAVLQAKPVKSKPILLLDDIFDRLDSERVERIVEMVQGDDFGQIFITDTDRQHLTEILKPNNNAKIFHVENGQIA